MRSKRYARIRNLPWRRNSINQNPQPSLCVFRTRTDRPTDRPPLRRPATALPLALHRHALTQPIPNPYEASFNSNLPFRDCSESCIFLSRTNVYHSITNRETFVPVSRPTFRLPPSVESAPGIIRYFLRDIFLRRRTTSLAPRRLHEFNFNFDFFAFAPTRAPLPPSPPPPQSRPF